MAPGRQRPLPAARRFSENAFVLGEPKLQFYLAAPLVTTNGHRLGTLCALPPPPPPAAPPGSPRAHAARVKGLWFDASPCVMCRKCMRLYERSLCRTGARAVAASAELCHTLLLFCALHGHALTLRLEVGILKAG